MAIGDDFSVAVNGNIRHESGTTRYTVLDLHRWLEDLADQQQGSGDDLLDITSPTPSVRATDNIITLNSPYNIDDTAAEYLYDGSIVQAGGDVQYSGLVVVGSVYGSTTLQVVQNKVLYDGDTPFWGTGINADPANNILCRMLIKTRTAGTDIDGKRIIVFAREWGASYAEFSVTMGLGNATAAIFTQQDLNNTTAVGTVATWTEITNTEGYRVIDLDNSYGNRPYYSEWNRDTYSINQLYERAKWLTRRGSTSTLYGLDGDLFRGPTHQILCDGPSVTQFSAPENVTWTGGEGQALADLDADSGSIQIDVVAAAGTFTRLSGSFLTDGFLKGMQVQFTGFSNSGNNVTKIISSVSALVITVTDITGLVNETGGGDERALTNYLWIQLLAGVAPTDNQTITGTSSGATAVVNVSVTSRTLGAVFIGQSTGTAIIGAYGVGIEALDLSANDKVTDLTDTLQLPPNNVKFHVYGCANGDRILLCLDDGTTAPEFDQLTLATTLNGAAETQVDVGAGNIPADTQATGVLRITLDSGVHRYQAYTAHDGNRYFTIASADYTDPNDATAGNGVMIAYMDRTATDNDEEVTFKYSIARTLFARVRWGGALPIKTFESTGALTSGGGSITVNRAQDY